MGYNVGNEQQRMFEADMEDKRGRYGILPDCLLCARFCKNYNAPDLSFFWCGDFEEKT